MGKLQFQNILTEKQPHKIQKDIRTVYAKHEGAVAAPTAGLHFSKLLMKHLELIGVNFAETTLHVGLGTFNPIMVEDLSKHRMESESIKILKKPLNKLIGKANNKEFALLELQ